MNKNLNKDKSILLKRLLAFLIDMILSLLPIVLWTYIFLFVIVGLIPEFLLIATFDNFFKFIVFGFILFTNVIIAYLLKGQTLGKVSMGFKVVNSKGKIPNNKQIIIRELVGKSIPILALFLVLNIFGFIIFTVANGLFVIFDKQSRSLFDYLSDTKVVYKERNSVEIIEDTVVNKIEKLEIEDSKGIDLHIFSSYSFNGKLNVEDIFKEASNKGLEYISITDRNCVKANLQAKQFEKIYKVKYISGVEIDCEHKGEHIYLLGYNIDSSNEGFYNVEYESLAKANTFSQMRVELFEKAIGFEIDKANIDYNRFHFISPEILIKEVLKDKRFLNNPKFKEYVSGDKSVNPVKHIKEDYFSIGKPAYVKWVYPSLKDMISLIKAANGKCIISRLHDYDDPAKLIEELLDYGIDGIEVFTPYLRKTQISQLLDIAKTNKIMFTSGSYYFGAQGSEIGLTKCPKEAENIIKKLINK